MILEGERERERERETTKGEKLWCHQRSSVRQLADLRTNEGQKSSAKE